MRNPCNRTLNTRFEQPAKDLVRRLLDPGANRCFDESQVRSLALWLLKTWLLLAHPATRYSDPGFTPAAWEGSADDRYRWVVTGEEPPDGLSLWVGRAFDRADGEISPAHIPLPTVVAGTARVPFHSKRIGIADLDINVAFHPHWEIQLPAGAAQRLWPNPPSSLDVLDVISSTTVPFSWLAGPTVRFAPGVYGTEELPPISEDGVGEVELLTRGFIEMVSW